MKRQNVIIVQNTETGILECFGNFKKMCDAIGLPYHSLKMKKFPMTHDKWKVDKVKFQ